MKHTHTHTNGNNVDTYVTFSLLSQLVITKQRDKTEVLFRRLLKEDKGAGQWEGTSYIDFLCNIHREIKEILS